MRIKFEDLIYLVPDYERWLTKCIDSKLSGLFKEEKAMLCHKFESVIASQYFPLGVKWTYRAYWSDWVELSVFYIDAKQFHRFEIFECDRLSTSSKSQLAFAPRR